MDIYDLKYDLCSSTFHFENDIFQVYAHSDEYLHEHMLKTCFFFKEFVNDNILTHFYQIFLDKNIINISYEDFLKIIECSIYFHDIGKLSFNFQINRLNVNNKQVLFNQQRFINKINGFDEKCLSIYHSSVGSLIFLDKFFNYSKSNPLLLLILSRIIEGHHTKIKDFIVEYVGNKDDDILETFDLISYFLDCNNTDFDELDDFQDEVVSFFRNEFDDLDGSVSFFYMYIYSLLIMADIYASDNYLNGYNDVKLCKFNNRIDDELKKRLNNSFFSKKYNENILNVDSFDFLSNLEEINDINILRKEMLKESSHNLLKNLESNKIFFLNLPTGAGKTNTSMKLALDILNNTSIDRIIYAMPFINIIEQNYDVIKDSFGLSEENNEIRKIYSGSESIVNEGDDELIKTIILNDDFYNYPVICTTFVSLFNAIIKNNKRFKYKLASLSNSVIILDEIQSLPIQNWNSLYYIINQLSIHYNIFFIIMSATLPDFNKLKLNSENELYYKNISLIKNPDKYFNHRLFNRTQICNRICSFELINDDYEEFIKYVLEIIQTNFNQGYCKGLMVFNTIKSSKFVFDKLSKFSEEYNFEIDLLNSSLMPATKLKIISKINNLKTNFEKKYILISTQSVEAGVDVSFDFIIRDFATLDSIEQVRGRCNRSRELNKYFNEIDKKGNVYLVKLMNETNYFYEYIYDEFEQDTRIKCTERLLNDSLDYSFNNICEYYENISKLINSNNDLKEKTNFIDRDNIKFLNNAQFSKLLDENNGVHIINNQEQFSIFIATSIPIYYDNLFEFNNIFDCLEEECFIEFYNKNKSNFIFSLKELKFIKYINRKSKWELYHNNQINGSSLLCYYKSLFDKLEKNDFNQHKIIKKTFSSIFYKFIINVTINSYDVLYQEIKENLEKFGFFYILDDDNIGDDEFSFYSLKTGFNFNPSICKML